MDLFKLINDNPFLTFAVICGTFWIISLPFQLLAMYIRHLNIKAQGWPPPNVDADGDPVSDETTEEEPKAIEGETNDAL